MGAILPKINDLSDLEPPPNAMLRSTNELPSSAATLDRAEQAPEQEQIARPNLLPGKMGLSYVGLTECTTPIGVAGEHADSNIWIEMTPVLRCKLAFG